jgi:hypothetical protein
LTRLQLRLVKTGGRLVTHARYYWLLLAESHLTPQLFGSMLHWIWALPVPTGVRGRRPLAQRGRKVSDVSVRVSVALCRASQFKLPDGTFEARPMAGGSTTTPSQDCGVWV